MQERDELVRKMKRLTTILKAAADITLMGVGAAIYWALYPHPLWYLGAGLVAGTLLDIVRRLAARAWRDRRTGSQPISR